jgi:hypothetical protein
VNERREYAKQRRRLFVAFVPFLYWVQAQYFQLFIIPIIIASASSASFLSLACLSEYLISVSLKFQIMNLDMLQTSTAYVGGTASTPLHLGDRPLWTG